ncbi:conserved hypothetical protein [uncultured Alphaproteobacteria bacterium]|uniref:DUF924 domain-containing protein n=1 Tax=uncultured Alphaproteobacteria bacterium TaxID=91750 RepID=A0A212JR38_9PROT|nr:conserved hypothetical protein [uncultured Alphaproteobacteria bacterium]
MTADEVVRFWREAGREKWFAKDEAFDAACRTRFGAAWERAAAGAFDAWAETPEGALGLVILLDQIPRNVFRRDPRTWAADAKALAVAERAVERGFDREVAADLRAFFYLPFEHAEDRRAQARSLDLFAALGDPEFLHWARHHHDIVMRFGRFPHRNAVLGRDSTPEELAFLEEDSFRG